MQKIIFLDFDGVITTMASRYALDRYKCDLLQQIIDRTGAKIVVSSSWRENSAEETIAELRNVPTCFKEFVPSWVDEIVGVTIRAYRYIREGVHLGIPRGVEIKQWIDTHLHRDEEGKYERKQVGVDFQYIILDDDSDMLLEHADHFIHTDGYLGMSQDDAIRAVCILNGCSPEEVEGIVDESPFQTFKAAEEEARRSIEEEFRERKEKEASNEDKKESEVFQPKAGDICTCVIEGNVDAIFRNYGTARIDENGEAWLNGVVSLTWSGDLFKPYLIVHGEEAAYHRDCCRPATDEEKELFYEKTKKLRAEEKEEKKWEVSDWVFIVGSDSGGLKAFFPVYTTYAETKIMENLVNRGWAFDNEEECAALCCQMNAVLRQFKDEPQDE